MYQGDQRIAPNDELKGKKPSGTKLAKKAVRLAHMNQPCLHEALKPSQRINDEVSNAGSAYRSHFDCDAARAGRRCEGVLPWHPRARGKGEAAAACCARRLLV